MSGADWLVDGVAGKAKKVPHPTRDDVEIAEKFLSEPEATRRLVVGVAAVAAAVSDVQTSGLTEEAICLLVQNSIGYAMGGNMVAIKTIKAVLVAAANLDKYLVAEEPVPKGKARR